MHRVTILGDKPFHRPELRPGSVLTGERQRSVFQPIKFRPYAGQTRVSFSGRSPAAAHPADAPRRCADHERKIRQVRGWTTAPGADHRVCPDRMTANDGRVGADARAAFDQGRQEIRCAG